VASVCVVVCTNHPLPYRHCHRVSSVSSHSLLPAAVETVRLRLALSRLRRTDWRVPLLPQCVHTLPLRAVLLLLLQLPLLLCSALLLVLLCLSASTHGSARRSAQSVPTSTTPSTRPLLQ
jgi:hypothetical protein